MRLEPVVLAVRPIRAREDRIVCLTPRFKRNSLSGQAMYRGWITRRGRSLELRTSEWALVVPLLIARGAVIDHAHLHHCLWAHDLDGGPDDPANVIAVMLTRLRPRLARLGLTIDVHCRLGYSAHDLADPLRRPLHGSRREAA